MLLTKGTTLAKKIGTATRQQAQARDLSSMHAPVVDVNACFNFFGQGSIFFPSQVMFASDDSPATAVRSWADQHRRCFFTVNFEASAVLLRGDGSQCFLSFMVRGITVGLEIGLLAKITF